MIVKILGILDILAALSFWLSAVFNIIPDSLILLIAIYLIVKGIIFIISQDIASILDILSGLIIYASLSFNLPFFISLIVVLFLIQKGIFSLIA